MVFELYPKLGGFDSSERMEHELIYCLFFFWFFNKTIQEHHRKNISNACRSICEFHLDKFTNRTCSPWPFDVAYAWVTEKHNLDIAFRNSYFSHIHFQDVYFSQKSRAPYVLWAVLEYFAKEYVFELSNRKTCRRIDKLCFDLCKGTFTHLLGNIWRDFFDVKKPRRVWESMLIDFSSNTLVLPKGVDREMVEANFAYELMKNPYGRTGYFNDQLYTSLEKQYEDQIAHQLLYNLRFSFSTEIFFHDSEWFQRMMTKRNQYRARDFMRLEVISLVKMHITKDDFTVNGLAKNICELAGLC